MDIQSLEINLLKASEIKNGDILLIRVDDKERNQLTKENVRNIYDQVLKMIKRTDIGIYFFPKNLGIEIIKNHVENIENNKNQIIKTQDENK